MTNKFIPKYGQKFWYEENGLIFWDRYYNADVQNKLIANNKCYKYRYELAWEMCIQEYIKAVCGNKSKGHETESLLVIYP